VPESTLRESMLCAIPARGGSKRLPRKNLRALAGKPMIAYTIEQALQSALFDEVYVCTEDREIADVALSYGAKVPFLMPQDLCGDLVASHIPCQHLAAHLATYARPTDTLVCLQPTSPLRSVNDLKAAVGRFQRSDFDFLVSITPMDPHDFHWAVAPTEGDYWGMYFGSKYMMERPLLPPVFRPNGSIKIARLPALAETGHFFGKRMGVIETPAERSVHVASEFDLKLCELLLADQVSEQAA
jgi:CMP-N,N'-diacetyllegionaminic acid synthase